VHVFFVPVAGDELIPALREGRGDIAAANLTITPEHLKLVDFSDPTRRNVSQVVVSGAGAAPIASVEDLAGKEVYVRKSSSSYESIEALDAEFAKAGKAPVKVRPAPEELAVEDILEMVNAGLVKLTIADDRIAELWEQIFKKLTLHKDIAIRTGGEIGTGIRQESPQLKTELNAFLARYPEGSPVRRNLLQRYPRNTKWAKEATSQEEIAKFEQTVEFFRKYGDRYDLDYLLVMAQG
jgi:ABC-type amino acid transport substrate-binding protein